MPRTPVVFATCALLALAAPEHLPQARAQYATPDIMGPIPPEDLGVERFELANGLRVIMRPLEGCGYAAMVTLFHFGESSDPEEKAGMARLNSRLYITGAAGEMASRSVTDWANLYPPPEEVNGVVGEDYIALATKFTGDKFEGEIKEVAARLSGVRPSVADLERERVGSLDAIRAFNQNLTPSVGYLNVRELLRPSPANFRFGGIAEHVQSITLADVEAHLKYFCPRNATLVVVGAIEPSSARALIENTLGPIPAGEKAPPARTFEAPVLGASKVIKAVTDRPEYQNRTLVMLGYHPPAPGDAMYPTFQVLIGYLYKGMNEYNAFPEKDRALAGLQVMYRTIEDNELVQVAGAVAEGASAEKAMEELRAFVKKAAWSFEASPKIDFETAQGAFRWFGLADADPDMMCESQFPLAFGMGRLEQMGFQTGGSLVRSFEDVTMDDLRKCAEQVFGEKREVSVTVEGVAAEKPAGEAAPTGNP